jgi:hypothetical protein
VRSEQTSPEVHFVPHEPQWFGSLLVLTHVPPQSVSDGVLGGQPHCPPEQTSGEVHVVPHAPQLLLSYCVSMQVPPQLVVPIPFPQDTSH